MQINACLRVDGVSLALACVRRSRMPVTAGEADVVLRSIRGSMVSRIITVRSQRNKYTVHEGFLHAADGVETVLINISAFGKVATVFQVQHVIRTAIDILRLCSNELMPFTEHGVVI